MNNKFTSMPAVGEKIRAAFKSIRSNRLRFSLTVLIMAVGITSLVGMLTAADALKKEVLGSFRRSGARSFTVRYRHPPQDAGLLGRSWGFSGIGYAQARQFAGLYGRDCTVSVFSLLSAMAVVRYANRETDPVLSLMGVDEHYMAYSNNPVVCGRGIGEQDVVRKEKVCVLGDRAVSALGGCGTGLIGKPVRICGETFRVVGIVRGEGSSVHGNAGRSVFVPVTVPVPPALPEGPGFPTAGGSGADGTFEIGVQVPAPAEGGLEDEMDRAVQLMRGLRRLPPHAENDFEVAADDALLRQVESVSRKVTVASGLIGLVTLAGAAVALMNILLAGVKERVREIGVRKALGASEREIRRQFLLESLLVCQTGCVLGMGGGLAMGNLVALVLGVDCTVPWGWMGMAVLLCMAIGMAAGYLPACMASRMDPVKALQME